MELKEVILKRSSIRAFRSDPVPRAEIEKIIHSGICAPSKGNSQIWEFVIITGEKKDELAEILLDLLKTDFIPAMQLGETDDDNEPGKAYKKAKTRSDLNKTEISAILSKLDISFDQFMLEGTFTFFNAPAVILVFADTAFAKDLPHVLSIGAAVENMLLTVSDIGLGACWIGGVWRYTNRIRQVLDIPKNKILLSSIALGYPDDKSPITEYKSKRDDINEFATWIGFDN
ncbi:MAG: nitroreductase [Pseudomonadota bacterium]